MKVSGNRLYSGLMGHFHTKKDETALIKSLTSFISNGFNDQMPYLLKPVHTFIYINIYNYTYISSGFFRLALLKLYWYSCVTG
jgi:hypothetical protein